MKTIIKTIALCGILIAPAINATGSNFSSTWFSTLMLAKNNKYTLLAATVALVTPIAIWAICKSKKETPVKFGQPEGVAKASKECRDAELLKNAAIIEARTQAQ